MEENILKNKVCSISIILIFSLFFSLTGCSQKIDSTATSDDGPLNITLIGASNGGTLFMVLSAVAECINMSYSGSNVTIVPGSTGANPTRMNNNEADASVTHSVTAYSALKGKPPYAGEMENIASVASLYPSVLQIAVDKAIGITSLDEFINNKMKLRMSIGQPGATSEILFKQIISEYGVTIEDIQAWGGEIMFQNIDESAQMLADGRIDGAVFSTYFPIPHLQEAAVGKDFVLITVNENILSQVKEEYGYQDTVIPSNTYPFLLQDMPTICSHTIIFVPKNSSDEIAYKIARSITENIDYLSKVHISMENLTPDLLVSNLGIPLHPGAEKYYREKGILK